MGRRDDEDEAEASAARDFVMARLLACRVSLTDALANLDHAAALFVDAADDANGKIRKKSLEDVDASCGAAAAAVQLAMAELENIDPEEGEPDAEEEDDESDEDEDEEEDERPAKRGRR